MHSELTAIGFEPYNKKICGYTPKYKRGSDIVLIYKNLIKLSDLRKLESRFSEYEGNVYIIVSKWQGGSIYMDIAICRNIYPLELTPARICRWNTQGTGIEWVGLR